MLKKHKNILFALIGIILIFFGYWYFVLSKKNKDVAENSLVAVNSVQGSATQVNSYDKEFVANLQMVRYIELNTEIFSKAPYKALSFPEVPFEVDYNIPAGRRNPFLPIGVDAGGSNTPTPSRVEAEVVATTTPVVATSSPKNAPKTTR